MLTENGYLQIQLSLPQSLEGIINSSDWESLDKQLTNLLSKDQLIHNSLNEYIKIKNIEHLISIRQENDNEDGIWHDDGSRELAFTLSLTKNNEKIRGGILQFRKKNTKTQRDFPTPNYGVLTIFKTGIEGYEHRVLKVTKGKRIICAGWIN